MGQIEITKDFQAKVGDRIRDAIGDLLTDEDIAAMVRKAVDDIFFTERKKPGGHFRDPIIEPPLIQSLIMDKVQPLVATALQVWIAEHPEEVKAAIETVLAQGIGGAILRALNDKFSGDMYTLQSNIMASLGQTM